MAALKMVSFSQLSAVKNTIFGAARKIFSSSYFVTALMYLKTKNIIFLTLKTWKKYPQILLIIVLVLLVGPKSAQSSYFDPWKWLPTRLLYNNLAYT